MMLTRNARMPAFVKHATADGFYWSSPASPPALRSFLREKRADLGGEQESGFEQAFSSLAYSYIKDKAPRLLDYIVGFQLVDRDDDNTKAMGVFGFKVGKQWLYAPVFFLNGDLKGHELLYLKNQDVFVPLKENWVNYVLSRKPHVLGEGSSRDVFQLGGLAPNLERLAWPPPHSKYGSAADGGAASTAAIGAMGAGLHAAMTPSAPAPQASAASAMPAPTPAPAPVAQPVAPTAAPAPAPTTQPAAAAPTTRPATPTTQPAQQPPVPEPPRRPNIFDDGWSAMGGPGRKLAHWVRPVLPVLAALAVKQANFLWRQLPAERRIALAKLAAAPLAAALSPAPDLASILAGDWQLAKRAFDWSQQYPGLKAGFDRFYGPGFFAKTAAACRQALQKEALSILPKTAAAAPRPGRYLIPEAPQTKIAAGDKKVRILLREDVPITKNLSDEQKQQALHHGYLVLDERKGEEFTKVYNTQVRCELQNPQESGLYEVLEKPGSFGRMLVLMHPQANDGKQDFATVVRLGEGSKAWVNAHHTSLFARRVEDQAAWREFMKGLADRKGLESGGTYLAVGENGTGSCPFEVREKLDDGRYRVDFRAHTDSSLDRSRNLPRTVLSNHDYSDDGPYVSNYNAVLVLNDRPGSALRAVGGELHVPESFKFLKIKGPPKPAKNENEILPECCPDSGSAEPRPIQPGNIQDLQVLFTEKTARLKLQADGPEVSLTTAKSGTVTLPWKQALFTLIRQHGVKEAAAQAMLKAARDKSGLSHTPVIFRLKYAEPYPLPGPGPGSPAMPPPLYGTEPIGYNNVNAIYPQDEVLPVPALDSARTDPRIYDPFLLPDPRAMNVAQQAAQEGQKEVFDTSMLAGLLRATRSEGLGDRFLPDYMKALDKLGRLLLLFYWHGEEFEDRYGRSDMPELEETIRSTIESLGDLVLKLKEKSVDTQLTEQTGPELEEKD